MLKRLWLWLSCDSCPICDKPVERGQVSDKVYVAHLGADVRVHRFCLRQPERCELGTVIRG